MPPAPLEKLTDSPSWHKMINSTVSVMKRFFRLTAVLFLLLLSFVLLRALGDAPSFDILITGGKIFDGSGNPWFRADIGISGAKIVAVGRRLPRRAALEIDASGLVVAPGFIDVHTHCDREIKDVPTADNYLLQGVTTVIGGNCGGHPFPLEELFAELEQKGISLNFGCLIGHNTIRRRVMGLRMDAPAEEELEEMKALVDQEMRAGALGFSTGLAYLPGAYAETEELVALASAAAPYGGLYASHIRDQGKKISESIEEAIEVGERNGIPVLVSHIKLAEDSVWGEIERIRGPVEEARKRGVEVFLDQYPYTATSSGFTSSLPSWCFEGGREKFLERLEDPETYTRIKDYVIRRRLETARDRDTLSAIYISRSTWKPEWEGKNLKEILLSQGKKLSRENAAELIIDIEKNGGAGGIFFQMDEKDVEALMRLPYTMHASDGAIQVPGKGMPHPRSYGTFPRVIARYVRDRGVLSLGDAIRKMTSLPAQVFRIRNRGMIREGMYADITIFDDREFADTATFREPHRYSRGLRYVIVNGRIVVKDNTHTGRRPGMIVYGPGKSGGDQ